MRTRHKAADTREAGYGALCTWRNSRRQFAIHARMKAQHDGTKQVSRQNTYSLKAPTFISTPAKYIQRARSSTASCRGVGTSRRELAPSRRADAFPGPTRVLIFWRLLRERCTARSRSAPADVKCDSGGDVGETGGRPPILLTVADAGHHPFSRLRLLRQCQ